MTQQIINIGSAELKGDGESIRSAFNKVNSNFTEIYGTSYTGNISFTGTIMHSSVGLQINNQGTSTGATAFLTIPPDAGANVGIQNNYGTVTITSGADPGSLKTWTFTTSGSLTAPGDVIPTVNLAYDLGSVTHQWRSLYVGTNTIYIGGVPLSINTLTNTLIVGTNSNISSTSTNIATEKYVIDYVTAINTGSANLGDFKIHSSAGGSTLGTVDNPNTGGWGGYDIYIDSGGDAGSNAKIYIPSVVNQAVGTSLQIVNNGTDTSIIQLFGRGGVQLVTNTGGTEKIFEFGDAGVLIFPDGTSQNTAYTGSTTTSTLVNGTYTLSLASTGPINIPTASTGLGRLQNVDGLEILVNSGGSAKLFSFANDGTLLMPADSTVRPPESISTTGGSLIFRAGDSQEQAAGSITLRAGDTLGSLGPANGGDFIARAGTTVTGDGGQAQLEGGTTVVGNGGALLLYSGQAVTGDGGDIALLAGTTVTGDGGGVNIESGEAVTGDAGDITITARGTTTGNGGNIELTAGSAITGYGGDIFLTAGDHVNTGAPGEPGVIRLRTVNYTSNKDWIFGNGNLSVPGVIYNNDTSNVGQLLLAGDAGESATYLALPSDVGSTSMNVRLANSNGDIQLYAGNNSWLFNNGGDIQLPRSGLITETIVTNELWGTTTTSLTLVPAGAANGTQRLEIYSTGGGEGDHIHITSGDQNQTDLFLGNDTQYFAVTASGANYIQARNGAASTGPGSSAGPGANVNISAGSAGDNGGNVADGNSGGDVLIASGISTAGLGGDIFLQTSSGPTGFGSIKLSTDGGSSYLEFDKDDVLTFPSGGDIQFDSSATSYIYGVTGIEFANATTQTTAWVGGGSSISNTTLTTINDVNTGDFQNTGSIAINYTAFNGDPGVNFDISYQSPLTTATGISVLGVAFPDSSIQTTAFTGTSALLDITNTNGIDTNYYITFVENRTTGQEVRADVDLTFNSWSNTLGAGNITVTSLLNLGRAHETLTTATTATSTVNYNCANSQIFFHTSTGTVANWTANFTNLSLDSGKATAINIVIKQGATGYYPSAVQIGGVAQTLNWQGNTSPTVSTHRTDVVAFTILNDNGTYTVLGQLTGF